MAPTREKAQMRYRPSMVPDADAIRQAADMLVAAKKPIIYGGGGIINAGDKASQLLRELVDLTKFPTTLTLMGLGALPSEDTHFRVCLACMAPMKQI